jgi:hypothetical protein
MRSPSTKLRANGEYIQLIMYFPFMQPVEAFRAVFNSLSNLDFSWSYRSTLTAFRVWLAKISCTSDWYGSPFLSAVWRSQPSTFASKRIARSRSRAYIRDTGLSHIRPLLS